MTHRIAILATVCCTALPASAFGQDFDFQDDITALHYSLAFPINGPGILPSNHPWSTFYEPGTYQNNGVTLVLSGFDSVIIPFFFIDGPPPDKGTPAFTLSQAMTTHAAAAITLENVPTPPAGDAYDLALYSTNSRATDQTSFALAVGSGVADRGIDTTINAPDPGQTGGPNDIFSEGRNYVLFDNVAPVNGIISVGLTPLTATGDLNAVQLVTVPTLPVSNRPGDFNRDGSADAADILAMEKALNNLPSFESANSLSASELLAIGDLNSDGVVNNADLQALINLLKSGGGSMQTVSEPSTFVLGVLAFGILAAIRRYSAN